MDDMDTTLTSTLIPWLFGEAKEDGMVRSTLISTGGSTGAVSTTSAATTLYDAFTDVYQQAKVENKSLNTYVSSMSDEELEKALMQFNLLESENNSINKTNIKK